MTPSIQSALQALLIAFETDPSAVSKILGTTAVCSKSIETHPTIPVNDAGELSGLGLLNGLLRAATGSVINAHYGTDGELTGFTVRREPRKLLAIPFLVYVDHWDDGLTPYEEFEDRITHAIRSTPGVYDVFLAEDFSTSVVTCETDEDLSAMISNACDPL